MREAQEGKRWELVWSSRVARQFRKLPRQIRAGMERKLRWLVEHVEEIDHEQLRGRPDYSLHIGKYRVLYRLDWGNQRIVIVGVGAHNVAYRR